MEAPHTSRQLLALAAALAVAGPMFAPASAYARPGGLGGPPLPAGPTAVRIAEEDLHVRVGFEQVEVAAALQLENRGRRTSFEVVFPCVRGGYDAGVTGISCLTPLRVSVRGKRLEPHSRWVDDERGEWVWQMALERRERVALEVSYAAKLVRQDGAEPVADVSVVYYWLRAGARWSGPIGRLDITVETPLDNLLFVAPDGYDRAPGRLTWSLRDVEPAEDLVLGVHTQTSRRLLDAFGAPRADELAARREAGRYDREALRAVASDLRESVRGPDGGYGELLRRSTARHGLSTVPRARLVRCVAESVALLDALASRPPP